MRPVQIPTDAPAGYPQASVQARELFLAQVAPFKPPSDYLKAQGCAVDQMVLIDAWLGNQLGVVGELKTLYADPAKNAVANGAFTSYEAALAGANGYVNARSALINGIGSYCSYCEIPLASNLAVEHVLPKSWFPELQLVWSNFLLACPVCNSIKGAWPNQVFAGQYHYTYDATLLLLKYYAWPHLYWQQWAAWPQGAAGPVLPFTYRLVSIGPQGGGWDDGAVVPPARVQELVDLFEKNQSLVTNGAFGFFAAPAHRPRVRDIEFFKLEIVAPGGNAAVPDEITRAMRRLIGLVGLNDVQPSARQEVSDLRVALRTQTYFRALSLSRRLGWAVTQNPALVPALVPNLLTCMRLTGFWSVWSHVFRTVADPTGANPSFQPAVNQAFPGTAAINWTAG